MNNRMDVSEIERNLLKIRMYRNEMSMNSDDIVNVLRNINIQYQSNSIKKLNNIREDFSKILDKINRVYGKKEYQLSNISNGYQQTARQTREIFSKTNNGEL